MAAEQESETRPSALVEGRTIGLQLAKIRSNIDRTPVVSVLQKKRCMGKASSLKI